MVQLPREVLVWNWGKRRKSLQKIGNIPQAISDCDQ